MKWIRQRYGTLREIWGSRYLIIRDTQRAFRIFRCSLSGHQWSRTMSGGFVCHRCRAFHWNDPR